jgi:hypothetical protein
MSMSVPIPPATAFDTADIESNRSGRLSDTQRGNLRGLDRAIRKNDLVFAAICLVLAVLVGTSTGPAPNAWLRPVATVAFFLVAAVELYRATALGDSLSQDLRSGSVQTIEGTFLKRRVTSDSRGSSMTWHYLEVNGRRFEVSGAIYEAAPEAGVIRLYFLPRSHKVVNMERLADRPLPPGVITPQAMIGTMAAAFRTHDHVQKAEQMAQLEAMEDAVKADFTAPATPPAPEQQDPRPLAEAILGTWKMGAVQMSLSFMPDGTMVANLPGGRQQTGRWSIGPDGRLHANALGNDIAGEASVAGDTLTIKADGRAMAYHRAAN